VAGLDEWRKLNGCAREPTVRETRTRAATKTAGAQTATYLVWNGCVAGAPVAHWKLTGVGHAWPGNDDLGRRSELVGPATTIINSAEEIWRFVRDVRR
jgi:poly(3-hydroxybutyrate) depolymerase